MSAFALGRLRSREHLVSVAREITTEIKDDDLPSLSAAVAFKIVLALFPSLVAAIGIFSLLTDPNDLTRLLDSLANIAPAGVVQFLEAPLRRLIENRAAGLAAVAGIAGGLWVASGAAVTLNRALTRAYDLAETRKLVAARVAALLVTAALLVALIGIVVLVVAGGAIEDRVLGSLPLTDTARGVFDFLSTVGRYLLTAVALMLLFAFIYWIGPNYDTRPPYPWISPGAALGVVAWIVVSALYGVYANNFGSYDSGSVYGPLGGAILFMLWLQLSMLVLLLGAEVNQTLRLRAGKRTQAVELAGFGGEPALPEEIANDITSRDDTRRAVIERSAGARGDVDGSRVDLSHGTAGYGDPTGRRGQAIVAALVAVLGLIAVLRRQR